jgi:hypothetical protein
VSANTTDGGTILVISEDDESDYYFALDNLPIRPEAVGGKVEKGAPTLKMGTVIEGLETVGDPAAKNVKDRVNCFVRYKEGWVQSMAKGGMGVKPVLEPFEFADKKGDAELQKGGATAAKVPSHILISLTGISHSARMHSHIHRADGRPTCSSPTEGRIGSEIRNRIRGRSARGAGSVCRTGTATLFARVLLIWIPSFGSLEWLVCVIMVHTGMFHLCGAWPGHYHEPQLEELCSGLADQENREFHPLDPKISAALTEALGIVQVLQ